MSRTKVVCLLIFLALSTLSCASDPDKTAEEIRKSLEKLEIWSSDAGKVRGIPEPCGLRQDIVNLAERAGKSLEELGINGGEAELDQRLDKALRRIFLRFRTDTDPAWRALAGKAFIQAVALQNKETKLHACQIPFSQVDDRILLGITRRYSSVTVDPQNPDSIRIANRQHEGLEISLYVYGFYHSDRLHVRVGIEGPGNIISGFYDYSAQGKVSVANEDVCPLLRVCSPLESRTEGIQKFYDNLLNSIQ